MRHFISGWKRESYSISPGVFSTKLAVFLGGIITSNRHEPSPYVQIRPWSPTQWCRRLCLDVRGQKIELVGSLFRQRLAGVIVFGRDLQLLHQIQRQLVHGFMIAHQVLRERNDSLVLRFCNRLPSAGIAWCKYPYT